MNVREKDQFESSVVDIAFPGNLKRMMVLVNFIKLFVPCLGQNPHFDLNRKYCTKDIYKLHVHEYNIGKSCLVPVKSGI